MKRIITILLICLVSLPVMGQRNQDARQKLGVNRHKTIKTFKNKIKDYKLPHYQVNSKRSEVLKYTKADKHSLDSVIIQSWNENLNEGTNTWKEEYTYDVNENVSGEIDYYWNGALWINSDKYVFTYDSNNPTQEIYYEWDNPQWVQSGKWDYTYDSSNKLTTILYYDLESNPTDPYGKWDYTYDGNGNLTLETVFYKDSGIWIEYLKYVYSYDNNGRASITAYEWLNSAWVLDWKDEYTYDGTGNLVTEIDSYRDGAQWVEYDKFEYAYDTNGNTIQDIGYHWNTSSSGWVEYEKYEYHHDLAYGTSDVIIPSWLYGNYDYVFYNLVTGFSIYNFIDLDWVEAQKTILFYSDYNNALGVDDELLANSVKIYPNPVTNLLTIDSEIPLTRVEIYSVLGRKVKEVDSDFESIPTNNLSNGVYVVRMFSENGLTTKKLIKK